MELDRAYASLPRLDCQRKCQESCGPIVFSGEERSRIEKRLGLFLPTYQDERCDLLNDDGACSVYNIRPMICRLWGLVKSMACPFGCVPERWLTEDDAHALLATTQEW